MQLTDSDKGILLMAARESIRSLFTTVSMPIINYDDFPNLIIKTGAFVTLTKKGTLRGCIGYLVSDNTLYDTVCDAAQQAAQNDPRFEPLDNTELDRVSIEISVLTPPVNIDSYEEIVIGKHGLIIEEPGFRGVLLPQVAVEHNFDVPRFLSAACEKAGLPASLWKERMLKMSVFEAIIFSEDGKRRKTYAG